MLITTRRHLASGVLLQVVSDAADARRHSTAVRDLGDFADFVHARVPSALRDLRIELVDTPDMAAGGAGHVVLGRPGADLPWDPASSPRIVGHELTHALVDSTAGFAVHELDADLVGRAFARAIGRDDGARWPASITRDVADFRSARQYWAAFDHPDPAIAGHAGDTHQMGGPVAAALEDVADRHGTAIVDEVAVRAVLGVKPRTDAALRAALDGAAALGDASAQIRGYVQAAWRDDVAAFATAARELHPDRPEIARSITDAARRRGVDVTDWPAGT